MTNPLKTDTSSQKTAEKLTNTCLELLHNKNNIQHGYLLNKFNKKDRDSV
jgi:hypothetical protein